MKTINFNNLLIISFILLFFLGCSSKQLVDISEDDKLDNLLDNIGKVEIKISASEAVKQLIIKSMVSLNSDIRINFVDKIEGEVLLISNNFLNQKFTYFCKTANDYLEDVTKSYLFDLQKNDEIFVFYSERFKSQTELINKNFPGVKVFKLNDDYDNLVKRVFELSSSNSRSELINRLIQGEDINFIPRPRNDFKRIYERIIWQQEKQIHLTHQYRVSH